MIGVAASQRFSRKRPCPVCGGGDDDLRGAGVRCHGYLAEGAAFAFCTREDHAGLLAVWGETGAYRHRLDGPCECGQPHGLSEVRAGQNGHGAPPSRDRGLVSRYPLRDEAGALVAVHGREDFPRDGKRMWWERPDGSLGLGGTSATALPLYGVDELAGTPTAEPVIVVEGEKARDTLKAHGFVAVGTVTGAAATPSPGSLGALVGRRVILWPDADTRGARHMQRVADVLHTLGHGDARVLRWALARPDSGDDAVDFFTRGGTPEELRALIDAAEPWRDEGAAIPAAAAGLVIVRLSEIKAQPVTWLWPGRIPRGKLTMLVGDPGLGKSLMLVDLAARITRGDVLPGSGTRVPAGDVIVLSAEDGPADTIRPRFDVAVGNPVRVHLLRAVKDAGGERPFTLASDLPLLEAAVIAHKPVAVIIDPISCYLGDRDSYKDTEVRALLAPLAALADRYQMAVVVVAHLGKNEQRRALYRAMGSIGFVAAARAVLAVAQDPEDKRRRLVAGSKANLSGEAAGLAYRVVGVCTACGVEVGDGLACRACDVQSVARLVWEADPLPGLDADRLLGEQATPEERDEARDADDFLRELLSGGAMRATEARKLARKNGIADRTLDRIKRRLKVRARRVGPPGADGEWWWELPEAPAKSATKGATVEKVALLGEASEKTSESARTSPKNATSHNMALLGGALSAPSDEAIEF